MRLSKVLASLAGVIAFGGLSVTAVGSPAKNQAFSLDEPAEEHCFAIDEEQHSGGILLQYQYVGGDEVLGFGYGTVTTIDGESWGYFRNLEGTYSKEEGAMVLTLNEYVSVDGDEQTREVIWMMMGDTLKMDTGNSVFVRADCDLISSELTERFPR